MKTLIITDENPKDAQPLSEAMVQQGHKIIRGYYEENGKMVEKEALYHCTKEMLDAAEWPKKAAATKKAAAKKK